MEKKINISLIRLVKAKQEVNQNQELEVEYQNGIYILTNNFKKFEQYKKNQIYIPVTIITDIKLVANHLLHRMQKEKLNPIENALLYNEYKKITGLNSNELAQKINVSQGNISNKNRLLKLPLKVQIDVIENRLTERHGRALLQLVKQPNILKEVHEEIVIKQLKVADAELLINKKLNKKSKEKTKEITKLDNKREIKNRVAIPAINQLEKDIATAMQLIEKYYPELEINLNEGTKNKDYIFEIIIKNIK